MNAEAATLSPRSADAEILERIAMGDAHAVEQLVRRYNRTLYRTARAILNDEAEAEDAVQETYIRALRSLDGFRGQASLSTWLVRIAVNEALMRRRRRVRRAEVLPLDAAGAATMLDEIPAPQRGPEEEAMATEMRSLLEKRIAALPEAYRTVFVMRAVEEMTVEETAAALGLPEATVRTRLFRARALLRGSLEAHLESAMGDVFAFDGARCDRVVARVLAAWKGEAA